MQNNDFLPAFTQNNVPVVIASSNMYAPYAGVFIQSLLDYTNEENNYDVIILEHEISDENKRLLKAIATGHTNVSVRFYDPSPFFTEFNFIEGELHFPIELYYRIMAPHILICYKKFITVDIDTLLMTDIAQLMDINLEGHSIGGVCDVLLNGMCLNNHLIFTEKVKANDYYQKLFGVENLKKYINNGLLIFDCELYRREVSIEKILDTAQKNKFLFLDQDVLNYLMKGKIKPIDFAWNVVVPLNLRGANIIEAGSKIYNGAYESACENPYLLHWAGKPKPWVCPDVPFGSEWWQTALRTPFVGHIIARMSDEQAKRRAYYKKRYRTEEVNIWDPSPKGINRTE